MVKNLFKLIIVLVVFGCAAQPKQKNSIINKTPSLTLEKNVIAPELQTETTPVPATTLNEAPLAEQAPSTETQAMPSVALEKVTTNPVKLIPRIGLIFSAGGAKTWAHIGFLKEIEKAKWPIHSAAGFEWGSVVAAVYANNLSSNEVEWELSKVRDFENLTEASSNIFAKKSVNDLKIPFVCSSFNIAKQTLYLLNRGQLDKLMPFCVAHPPLSAPFSQSVAGMHDVARLAQHLRATGANKIILINVMAQNTKRSYTDNYLSAENIIWAEAAALMDTKIVGVDEIIKIDLADYSISDLSKKREIIAKGAELSYDQILKLSKKYGL